MSTSRFCLGGGFDFVNPGVSGDCASVLSKVALLPPDTLLDMLD